jgi:hypothetical protein
VETVMGGQSKSNPHFISNTPLEKVILFLRKLNKLNMPELLHIVYISELVLLMHEVHVSSWNFAERHYSTSAINVQNLK